MDIDLSAFHFLRPLWLLLIVPAIVLPWGWMRRHDLRRQLRGLIAPHLVEALLIIPEHQPRVQPVHLLAVLLGLGAVAAAGPTWTQDTPDFLDNRAPLILAVDLSPSMDANDVPPSRLLAAKHMLHDLIQRRAGARTALIAYAGTAHLVLPATEDPALLDTFLQALSTDLISQSGKDVIGVIEQARKLLDAEKMPGTLLLVTDGGAPGQLPDIPKLLTGSDLQVLVLAVGSQDSGVVLDAKGRPRITEDGQPVQATFDTQALKQLAQAANAPLGSLTLNDDDLDWVTLHAQQHFQAVQGDQQQVHWKDAGYWLCWPLALVALCCVRRGWRVNWLGVLALLMVGAVVEPARAGALADAFLTPDQQGRWAFEHRQFPQAAEHFSDRYWKGVAAYNAADYPAALANFAGLDRATAHFYLGNIYVHLFKFPQAISAYQQALAKQPDFPQAKANLALAQALLKDYEDQQEAGTPDLQADKVVEDQTPSAGQQKQVSTAQAASDEQWLNNLTTSPAQFLKRKFTLQNAARQPLESKP
ncbi:VWA domain-containing protein [Pseudomonas sp. H9]|uniref:vWA domain-containing protein n=1 Tax=Pseudomonas sp. H9 TaxID=483968 RepID=UPI001057605B|nr:VWA domain-containing protein [Pseudomonas sp. H9]TDF84332.1 VWA domain-containing protein [Pseudomonas sp. H9]